MCRSSSTIRRRWLIAVLVSLASGHYGETVPKIIDRTEVQALLEAGAQLVDVLPEEEFAEEHLPGAINMPLRSIDREALETLDPGRPVVVYCFDSA